jgi:hypothetical protein
MASSTGSKKRRILLIAGIIVAVLVVWIAIDLYAPRAAKMRDFDADEVARLETAMWRSYYSKEQVRLFLQLGELLRKQYNMPLITRPKQPSYSRLASKDPITKKPYPIY